MINKAYSPSNDEFIDDKHKGFAPAQLRAMLGGITKTIATLMATDILFIGEKTVFDIDQMKSKLSELRDRINNLTQDDHASSLNQAEVDDICEQVERIENAFDEHSHAPIFVSSRLLL